MSTPFHNPYLQKKADDSRETCATVVMTLVAVFVACHIHKFFQALATPPKAGQRQQPQRQAWPKGGQPLVRLEQNALVSARANRRTGNAGRLLPAVPLAMMKQQQEMIVRGNNSTAAATAGKLTKAKQQKLNLKLRQEQAIARLEQKFNAVADAKDNRAQSQAQSAATSVAATGKGTAKHTKKKLKIKLPEPERFAPRVVVPPPVMLCQPVAPSPAPTSTAAATTTTVYKKDKESEVDGTDTFEKGRRLHQLVNALAKSRRPAPGAAASRNNNAKTASGTVTKATKAQDEATVTKNGMTRFLHVPHLPNSEHTSFLLKRLAKEFAPIIQRRNYSVLWVSEMCCCSDGVKVGQQQGDEHQSVKRIKVQTASGSEDLCGGYNRTWRLGKDQNQTMHSIHIRLRDRINHYKFKNYHQISTTMAHELAHCVHQNHSPAFYKLMEEIKQEHQALVLSGDVHQNETAEQQFGFDIYRSSSVTSRF